MYTWKKGSDQIRRIQIEERSTSVNAMEYGGPVLVYIDFDNISD